MRYTPHSQCVLVGQYSTNEIRVQMSIKLAVHWVDTQILDLVHRECAAVYVFYTSETNKVSFTTYYLCEQADFFYIHSTLIVYLCMCMCVNVSSARRRYKARSQLRQQKFTR